MTPDFVLLLQLLLHDILQFAIY